MGATEGEGVNDVKRYNPKEWGPIWDYPAGEFVRAADYDALWADYEVEKAAHINTFRHLQEWVLASAAAKFP